VLGLLKTQVFHASHDAVNGTVPVNEIFDGEGSEAAGVFVVTEIDSRIASVIFDDRP
jgi:hypothetical protein